MTFIVQCMRMKTTFVEKTSHEIPDGTDYFKLQMEEIFKTMFNNAQETRLTLTVITIMAVTPFFYQGKIMPVSMKNNGQVIETTGM